MEWKTSYLPEQKIVVIETQGVADDAGSLEMAKSIMGIMMGHKARLCLIDHRAISSVEGSAAKIYFRPRILHESGTPTNLKLTEVVLPIHDAHFGFFETVCRNNGLNLRIFRDREPAIRWLTQ